MWTEDFTSTLAWTAQPATDVRMQLASDSTAALLDPLAGDVAPAPPSLRVDFIYPGSGWAIARREVDLELPEHFAFSFWIRGESAPQTLEFKLVDASGENVWWSVRRDFVFGAEWELVRIRARDLSFAWGPQGGGVPGRIGAIEIAITASSGGSGTVWIDGLVLDRLPTPPARPPHPRATASSTATGATASLAIDGEANTTWMPAPSDPSPSLTLDLRAEREFDGLLVDWSPRRHAVDYEVESSEDGRSWRSLAAVRGSNGGRDWLWLPDSSARWLRLRVVGDASGSSCALSEFTLQAPGWAGRREDLLTAIAATHPRGAFPRAWHGEQVFWTVVGVDADPADVLMSEDGAIEVGPWQPSLEPFLEVDGRVIGWADVEATCGLRDGDLPMPWVRWEHGALALRIEASAIGDPGRSAVAVRYHVANHGPTALTPTVHLAIRPWQVNPPVQFLNRPGGIAPIERLRLHPDAVEIDGRRAIALLETPARRSASSFHGGDVVAEHLLRGTLPTNTEIEDPQGLASGLLSYPLALAPGDSAVVTVLLDLHGEWEPTQTNDSPDLAILDEEIARAAARWRSSLDRVKLRLPDSARWIGSTLRSQVAYVLINRDGPAIQPGSRSYARSWIRDGALTSSAMLRLGHDEVAREFLEWFAPHQFADGKIPCVVDARGGDPVPEHDSSGQFVFLVGELLRTTGDVALATRMWPRVERAVAYLDSLRGLRRTEAYTQEDLRLFYGLLPESISHEGYSAAPMHSYWDDFWALRGFRDAAWLATELDLPERGAHWRAVHDEFAHDVARSVERALEVHGIDYVPGCADLGDFDATSTTIALSPTGAAPILPPTALDATFERYWEFFVQRRAGAPWDAYTPYELRNVGAFVHLGWRERAHELLAWFREHQRPAGWNHWAEVVGNPERASRFLGDMPHTWVGSDFARAVLDMFAYVGGDDDVLVLAAGIPASWIEAEGGVAIADLPTPFGGLDLALAAEADAWIVTIGGGVRAPVGGVRLRLPLASGVGSIQVDGQIVEVSDVADIRLDRVPASVRVPR